MAITTYAELQTAAANWLVRGDLTARVPEFIALAEARLNRVLRTRLAETEATLTATTGVRTISLPATFAEPVQAWIKGSADTDRAGLRFVDPGLLTPGATNARPQWWTVDGANLAFDCPPDQAYTTYLRYLAKYALSDGSPTNSLLTDYPDAYLFATLCEAAPFLRDAELSAAYEARLERAIDEINAKEHRSRAGSTLGTEVAELMKAGRRSGYNIMTDRV